LKTYDEKFESVGLDEGYLNFTPRILQELHVQESLSNKKIEEKRRNEIIHQKGMELMKSIQKDVLEKTGGLTLSLGMAPNRYLSKLASEKKKPNGCFILRRDKEKILEFLDSFFLGKIKYIGPHNERIIRGLGKKLI
jgi:nucleotidyltransferase/DNA polymerase involved in DNA repair